jgi:hypothetical protein
MKPSHYSQKQVCHKNGLKATISAGPGLQVATPTDAAMQVRWNYRLTAASESGCHIIMFRIGVGYWPCLYAPFLQIVLGKHIFEFWYGLPSYKTRP